MKKFIKILLCIFEGILILTFIIYSVFATMLIKVSGDGMIRDGFGRILQPSPFWFPINEHYAGFGWFLLDTILGFVLIIFIYFIFITIQELGKNKKQKNPAPTEEDLPYE